MRDANLTHIDFCRSLCRHRTYRESLRFTEDQPARRPSHRERPRNGSSRQFCKERPGQHPRDDEQPDLDLPKRPCKPNLINFRPSPIVSRLLRQNEFILKYLIDLSHDQTLKSFLTISRSLFPWNSTQGNS